MPEQQDHPTPEKLAAYGLGQLAPEEATLIEEHITHCGPCCETILDDSSDDTFIDLLAQAKQTSAAETDGDDRIALQPNSDAVPKQLAEHPRYEIKSLIGRGGMGDVYKATHRKMERKVALKVINRGLVQKMEAVERFHREVKTAAQLTHPNIVTAHDADHAGDYHFMVMEYVDGVDLSEIIRDRGPLPIAEACDYIRQAATGLQHAHEQGMVHRDIKPHNLMVTADGTVKILDFGLASLAPDTRPDTETVEVCSDLTAAGTIMGTPDFISPEQAEDAHSADIRSDIYSLGSTLYYLLSGRPPFHDGSVMSKLKNLATKEPIALESLRDDLPRELTKLVARMTAKDPEDRFQAPADVAAALQAFVATGTPHASPQPATQPERQGSGAFSRWAGGVVLAGAAALAGLLFYLQRDTPEKDRDRLDSFLATGESQEPAGDILQRLLRTERGRSYLRKLDAEYPKLAYTSGKFSPGYTAVAAMAYVDRIAGVDKPELLVLGNSSTTSGMHSRNLPEELIIQSIEFDNAPDDTCRAIVNVITLQDTEFMELKPGSLYESSIGIKDLLGQNGEDSASLFDAFMHGEFVRKATGDEAARSMWPFQSELRPPSPDQNPAMRPLLGLTLSGVRDKEVKWVFGQDKVRITNNGQAIPAEISSEIVKNTDAPRTIEASWSLRNRNSTLKLFNMKVDGAASPVEVALPFSVPGNLRVNLGGHQYDERRTDAITTAQTEASGPKSETDFFSAVIHWVPPGPKQIVATTEERFEAEDLVESAQQLVEDGNLKAATNAYLKALRLTPSEISYDIVELFERTGRIVELGKCINETGLKRRIFGEYLCKYTIRALMKNAETRDLAHELLKNYFEICVSRRAGVLSDPDDYGFAWKDVPDLIFFLRAQLIPTGFEKEGAGWGRYSVQSAGDRGTESGPLTEACALFFDKDIVKQFTSEVRTLTKGNRDWKGGLVLLATLEAELGNFDRSAQVINENFMGPDGPIIPVSTAWLLGLALEGKDQDLDQIVIRLYEYSLREIALNLSDPDRSIEPDVRSLSVSPLNELARLYAKYGRKREARQLLYGLVRLSDQHPLVDGYKPSVDGGWCLNPGRCNACHRTEMNRDDYIVMSDVMTDIGYPVDSFISLARIDASFGNASTSSDGWIAQDSAEGQRLQSQVKSERKWTVKYGFLYEKSQAEQAVTPRSVIDALELGTFESSPRFSQKTYDRIRTFRGPRVELRRYAGTLEPETRPNYEIDLMLSVRGEGPDAKATVFSPVIDVLKLAADFKGENAEKEIADLDARLHLLAEVNSSDVQAAVASTVFAFLRQDLETAEERLKALKDLKLSSENNAQQANATLWLVARHALQYEQTRIAGAVLAEKAKSVAETLPDSGLKEAILRERSEIGESLRITRARSLVNNYGDVVPETIIEALDDGLFAYPLDKNHPESDQPSSWGGTIGLRTSVRNEGGHGKLFSPVIDLLSLVATPRGAVTEESILKLDAKLVELCEQRGRYRIEALVAATVFAYQRGDLETAAERLADLRFRGDYYRDYRSTPFDVNLWLAVRNALKTQAPESAEETIALARTLDAYAVKAGRKSDDPQVEQALLWERDELLQRDRLEEAKAAFADGDREHAKEILRTVPGVGSAAQSGAYWDLPKFDSDTAVAYKLAELLEEESDWMNAADAYLVAYRGQIQLLTSEHLTTFKKGGRTSELVEILTTANLARVGNDYNYAPIEIVESLLSDENTRADGHELLKHLWADPQSKLAGSLLSKPAIWQQVPDLIPYLRVVLLPANNASDGAGWTRFDVRATNDTSATKPAYGFPLGLDSLLYDKAALRKLSKEVAFAIEQRPDWKAGPAVLAFVEAEIGNYKRATELVKNVLADAETRPIPSDSAWLFGMALEGRDDDLDRQVIRLYESSLPNRPERTYRESAIPKLARLHARFGQRSEARQFLHRMTTVDYDPRRGSPICVYGRSVHQNRCTDCHSGKSNLLDVCLMSDTLTDLGYPVDSLISLARIDASFGNAFCSDDTWTKKRIPEDFYSSIGEGRAKFVPLKNKAMGATTPQAVLEALQSGVFSGRDMTKPAPENATLAIDLMTSVRGVDGNSVLYSPALEVLELAAKAIGDEAAIANVQIDQLLSAAFDENPHDLETGIAATVFAFLRNELDSASDRLKRLQAIADYPQSDGAALWLVARQALRYDETRIMGAALAERALNAAEIQANSGLKDAILYERSRIQTD